jgi:prevent-host-death family protein
MTRNGQVALEEVKNDLSEVVDQVERQHGRVVIIKHGRPAAVVVVSVDDLDPLAPVPARSRLPPVRSAWLPRDDLVSSLER